MSTITVVGTLLLLIIAAAVWAIMPRQVGTLVGSVLVAIAAVFLVVNVVA